LEKLQNPSVKFYETLIDTMYDTLLDYARLRVSDTSRAQDIVQDACLLAWEKIDSLISSPNPNGWMMNTLKNCIHKHFADIAAEMKLIDSLTAVTPETTLPPDTSEIISSFSSILTPPEQRIVNLKEQGYKHREIAEALGVKPGTIDSAVSRIKTKITKMLEG
jgi:RNA polymerase sigma-70 factor (ECF subfamily)